MSTSTKILVSVGGVATLVVGIFIGGLGSSRPVAPPQQIAFAPPRQGDAVLEQVMEIMRSQADDYRKAIQQQAEVNQRLLSQHAQSITEVLAVHSQSATQLIAQAGHQVEQLAHMEQTRYQEANRQTASLVNEVKEQAKQRSMEVADTVRENERLRSEKVAQQEAPRWSGNQPTAVITNPWPPLPRPAPQPGYRSYQQASNDRGWVR